MMHMDDEELFWIVHQPMPPEQQKQLSALVEKNSLGTITDSERAQLEILGEMSQNLRLRKIKALNILIDRGYHGITLRDYGLSE